MQQGSNFKVAGPQINQFNNISPKAIPRSAFTRDFTRRSTFDEDYLVPIFVDEILPGDDVHVKMTALTRMATPIKPLMDNLYLDTFWFFIPNRLVWQNWQKLQGQQTNPGDSVAYSIPVLDVTKAPMSTTGFAIGSVYDYLGLRPLVSGLDNISCLFNRAYDLVWNDWFRDENLQNSIPVPTNDGPDDPASYVLRKRNKRKDYITSCLPSPQKGAAVNIPLGTTAPIIESGAQQTSAVWTNPLTGLPINSGGTFTTGASGVPQFATSVGVNPVAVHMRPQDTWIADLTTASTVTINALRQAALYQQILELDARGGTRYVESIYSRFGVVSPDFRLQRPELIGQGTSRINIYAVPQTTPSTSGDTPQGNLAAFGTNIINGDHGCRYSATEHGMIIGLANVRADLTYQQMIPRMFTRSTRLDFYEPLQNGLGEQAVLNREVYADGSANDTAVFGYQERFAEYRFKMSEITGAFRSDDPTSLDVWHVSQDFASLPALNSSFIEENVPIDRVVAVPSEPSFLFDASYSYHHVRPMPIRSNPGIDKL